MLSFVSFAKASGAPMMVLQWAIDSFDELQLFAKHCLHSEDVYYGSSRHPGGFFISTESLLKHLRKTESGNLFDYTTLQGQAREQGTWDPIHHCLSTASCWTWRTVGQPLHWLVLSCLCYSPSTTYLSLKCNSRNLCMSLENQARTWCNLKEHKAQMHTAMFCQCIDVCKLYLNTV